MNLHHLEWLIGEGVPDPEMVLYEVLPDTPVQAERIIERCVGLPSWMSGRPERIPSAERVRQAFGHIINDARARDALLDLQAIERGVGKPPWRDLLKELRHDRGRFAAAIRDKSARIALRWALHDLAVWGLPGPRGDRRSSCPTGRAGRGRGERPGTNVPGRGSCGRWSVVAGARFGRCFPLVSARELERTMLAGL
jgi:hypothetical protein